MKFDWLNLQTIDSLFDRETIFLEIDPAFKWPKDNDLF